MSLNIIVDEPEPVCEVELSCFSTPRLIWKCPALKRRPELRHAIGNRLLLGRLFQVYKGGDILRDLEEFKFGHLSGLYRIS
jgi:hypothetical protein